MSALVLSCASTITPSCTVNRRELASFTRSIMAAVLAVLEAYVVLEQVNNIYAAARDRIDKASKNPTLADTLGILFNRLLKELAPLATQCENNTLQLSDEDLDFFTVRIE